MKKLSIVAAYAFALISLRMVDSIVTHSLLSTPAGEFTELNPFAETDKGMSVFFSPVLLALSLISIGVFAWMVYHPKNVLLADRAETLTLQIVAIKECVDFPFLLFAFIAVATLNNTSMLMLGQPLLPNFINDFMVDSPVVGLICIAAVLYLLVGRVSRRAMLAILNAVSADDARP